MTDQDRIIGHPFQASERWEDICGYEDEDGWLCGYVRAEHADQGEREGAAS